MYYKAPDNSIHYLDDSKYEYLLPESSVYITDEQAEALSSKPLPPDYKELRKTAYINEADPLFFKAQRGECTQQDWLDKIAEIKARYS